MEQTTPYRGRRLTCGWRDFRRIRPRHPYSGYDHNPAYFYAPATAPEDAPILDSYFGGPYQQTPYLKYLWTMKKNWIGKQLVRRGQVIPRMPTERLVFEFQIPDPHLIIGAGEYYEEGTTGRVVVYVDKKNIILNVRYI